MVGGYSDGGQVALELGARHPDVAGALIVGGAYPDWAGGRAGVFAAAIADFAVRHAGS